MVTWSWKRKMGEIDITQHRGDDVLTGMLNIYRGNCLFVAIYEFTDDEGNEKYNFYTFANDVDHFKRCLGLVSTKKWSYAENKFVKTKRNIYKDDADEWTCVRLNTWYKESLQIAKLLARAGIKVELYYDEPKEEE